FGAKNQKRLLSTNPSLDVFHFVQNLQYSDFHPAIAGSVTHKFVRNTSTLRCEEQEKSKISGGLFLKLTNFQIPVLMFFKLV
ncbi:MAG: hypothetical protein ACOCXG_04225, partial [Nanoarchaeota archaeon]